LILSTEVKQYIVSLLYQSAHPLSKAVLDFLNVDSILNITDCKEIEGKGIEGWINDTHFKIGSAAFVGGELQANQKGTKVIVKIDSYIVGEFLVTNSYRFGISSLMESLKKNYSLSLLSGDNDSEAEKIEQLLGVDSEIYFNQTPEQKLKYIYQLQHQHQKNVMMVGDGLNDAGALKQSNIGIAVADGGNSFTPSCDGVIDGTSLNKLNQFLNFAKAGKKIILFT
jgi:Cu+-exporting ATPase